MPTLVLLAGPNGAGKTTFINRFLRQRAEAVREPSAGGVTPSGLPRRVPRANLVAGGATQQQTQQGGPQVSRAPDDVRGRREDDVGAHPVVPAGDAEPVGQPLREPPLDPARGDGDELGCEGVVRRVGEHVGQGLDEPVGALRPVYVQHAPTSPWRPDPARSRR